MVSQSAPADTAFHRCRWRSRGSGVVSLAGLRSTPSSVTMVDSRALSRWFCPASQVSTMDLK